MASPELREQEIFFPPKFEPAFDHHNFKVLHGGRGGGKSWAVARALLLMGLERPLRILCTRETQKSMRDSVHRLLGDQIAEMGLAAHYQIQQIEITGYKKFNVTGKEEQTKFIFAGLSDLTVDSIKSFERCQMCWVEEAHAVTDNSWKILLPTLFRKGECEVWITFNPSLDTDPTWVRFVERPPPDTLRIEMNYTDNPWFPEPLNELRLHDQRTLAKYEYEWIWEGKCRPAISGAIYAEELADMFARNRIRDVPIDAAEPVYAAFDLGWNDATSIVICQNIAGQLRVIDYIEDDHKTPDDYSAMMRAKSYKIVELFLPHDANQSNLDGVTRKRMYERLNWVCTVLPKSDPERGIETTRTVLKSAYIDQKNCARLIECLRRYRRAIPVTTGEPHKPLHDEFSHGADAMRYAALAIPHMRGDFRGSDGGLALPPLKWKWKP